MLLFLTYLLIPGWFHISMQIYCSIVITLFAFVTTIIALFFIIVIMREGILESILVIQTLSTGEKRNLSHVWDKNKGLENFLGIDSNRMVNKQTIVLRITQVDGYQ